MFVPTTNSSTVVSYEKIRQFFKYSNKNCFSYANATATFILCALSCVVYYIVCLFYGHLLWTGK